MHRIADSKGQIVVKMIDKISAKASHSLSIDAIITNQYFLDTC